MWCWQRTTTLTKPTEAQLTPENTIPLNSSSCRISRDQSRHRWDSAVSELGNRRPCEDRLLPPQWHQWGLSGNLDLQLSPSSSRWLERHFLCQSVASAETKLRAWTSALHPEVARGICLLLNYGVGVGFQNGGNHEFSQWNHMYNSIMTEAVTFAWHLFF